MSLTQALFVLVLAYPKMCPGELVATEDDITRVSNLLQELATRQGDLHEKVISGQVSLRSVEATVNRLMSENAELKASVNLLEVAATQRAYMEDMNRRLSALEASIIEARGKNFTSERFCGGTETLRDTTCSVPFTEVLGRCVYADPSTSGTWEEMRHHCKTMKADLVVIDSADFLWYLIRYLQDTGRNTGDYWVGGHRESGTGAYHWVDGSSMKMGTPFWGYWDGFKSQQPYDSPKELHICMSKKGLYFMHSCSVNHIQPPICQRK